MHSNPALARRNRSTLLDCIRGIAVFMVVCYHIGVSRDPESLDEIALFLSNYGLFGVDIFFPLSGFLITGFLVSRYKRQDILVFFMRRFFRIVPLYMAALSIFLLSSLILGINLDTLPNLWKNAIFLTGWAIFLEGRDVIPYTITWSVSVEEFAYVLFGLGAFCLKGRLGALLFTLVFFAVAVRFAINISGVPDVYYFPPARLDSIALGGLTALAAHRKWPVIYPFVVVFFLSSIVMQFGRIQFHSLIYLQISVVTCVFIHVASKFLREYNPPVLNGIALIGFYSYFIYLFHYFNIYILELAQDFLSVQLHFWLTAFLVIALTYVQALASYRFFEGPLMGYGRYLEDRIASRPIPPTKTEVAE